MSKKWWFIGIAVIVLAGAFTGYQVFSKKSTQPTSTQNVSAISVRKGNLLVTVSGSGVVEPVNTENIMIRDSGQIKEVLVKEGAQVKKGQQLATYEGKDNSDSIQQEKINLEKNQIDLDNAEKSLQNITTGTDVDSLKSNIKKLQLSIQQSQLRIQSYQKDEIPPSPIVSPIDGVVTQLNVNNRQNVNVGSSIGKVTNYDDLQLVIQVDELDINKIKEGQAVSVSLDALPNQTIAGTVSAIANDGKSQNGVSVYDVTIHLENNKNIKSGMTAQAEIKVADKQNVLLVPIEAVEQMRDKSFVLVASGTDTSRMEVQIGMHNENFMEITGGLHEGDQIVLPGINGTSQNQQNRNAQFRGFGGLGGGSRGGTRGGNQ